MTELITIDELIGKGSFCIPKYQRGYRWTQDEVEKLLNDIYEFSTDETNSSEYYCLQPIVVKKTEEGWYRIVDGQQRITTISLILGSEKFPQKAPKINIKYDIDNNELDKHYKKNAGEVIKGWISEKENELNKFKENLLKCTKVIWYELDEGDNEHKVFERLNVGKIPLTSAELIKATLLNSKNFTRDSELSKIQLALQWDEVEHTLQDDAFWCFLSNDTDKTSTRIDRIFELYYAETDSGRNIFEIFREKSKGKYQKEWNKIYNFFRRNVDLFNDPQAQGMMGFVYFKETEPKKIKNIFFKKENNEELRTKEEIIVELKNYCATKVNICNDNEIKNLSSEDSKKHIKEYIENLSYEKNKENINNILLLTNIGKVAFDGNKFPFDKYKARKDNDEYGKINYDIEHISSQTENDLSNEKERFFYLLSLLVAYSNEIKRNNELEIESLKEKYKDDKIDAWKDLSELYKGYNIIKPEDLDIKKPEDLKESDLKKIKDILNKNDICKKYIDDSSIDTDSIGNLVLLDSKTNRSYKNSVFALKKDYIFKSKDFIPPLTICAFMRVRVPDKNSEDVEISSYVSQDVKWNKSDCELNKNNIINSINYLLSDGKSK